QLWLEETPHRLPPRAYVISPNGKPHGVPLAFYAAYRFAPGASLIGEKWSGHTAFFRLWERLVAAINSYDVRGYWSYRTTIASDCPSLFQRSSLLFELLDELVTSVLARVVEAEIYHGSSDDELRRWWRCQPTVRAQLDSYLEKWRLRPK